MRILAVVLLRTLADSFCFALSTRLKLELIISLRELGLFLALVILDGARGHVRV